MKEMLKDSSQVAYKTRFKELRWRKLADPRSNHEESVPQALSRKFRQDCSEIPFYHFFHRQGPSHHSQFTFNFLDTLHRQFRNICKLERLGTLATMWKANSLLFQTRFPRTHHKDQQWAPLRQSFRRKALSYQKNIPTNYSSVTSFFLRPTKYLFFHFPFLTGGSMCVCAHMYACMCQYLSQLLFCFCF